MFKDRHCYCQSFQHFPNQQPGSGTTKDMKTATDNEGNEWDRESCGHVSRQTQDIQSSLQTARTDVIGNIKLVTANLFFEKSPLLPSSPEHRIHFALSTR